MQPDIESHLNCLACGAEMEHGTVECVGTGFERWYEFATETEKAKKGFTGFFAKQTIAIPSTVAEHPAWHCPRCRKVLLWVDSKS